MIQKISTHSSLYRGFTIVKLPGNTLNPITRYHVMKEKDSFGKFDAMAEATQYIDNLYEA